MDSSGLIVSMRCTSDDGPSVATVSACVSPRVNSAEPWARGRRPTSTEIGRMVSEVAAVHADALVEHQLADDLLVQQAGQALREARRLARLVDRPVGVFLGGAGALQRADGVGDGLLVGLDPTGQVAAQAEEQLRGRLGVRQGAVVGLDLELEESGQVAQLQVAVRVGLAGEDQRVEVAALLDVLAAAEGGLEEADVEADVVADEERVARPVEELLRGLCGRRARP